MNNCAVSTWLLLTVIAFFGGFPDAPVAGAQSPPATTVEAPTAPEASPQSTPQPLTVEIEASPGTQGEATTLVFYNRPIVTLRARVDGRTPAERVAFAHERLTNAVETFSGGTFETQTTDLGAAVTYRAGELRILVFVITPLDIDTALGMSVEEAAGEAASALTAALVQYREQHDVDVLIRAGIRTGLATLLFVLAVRLLALVYRRISRLLPSVAGSRVKDIGLGGVTVLEARSAVDFGRRLLNFILWVVGLIVGYLWLAFALEQFPYTRPWGERLGEYLVSTFAFLALGVVRSIPGLFTVFVIFWITRFVVGRMNRFLRDVEEERVQIPWVHPDIALPTRRLLTAALWLFAVAVAYPYLPGSGSDAFKGVSIFAGLVLTLGSSGVVNQAMSGLVLMYSRALKTGDYVRIGETEGVVISLNTLATKIRTPWREEVTIPNGVVLGNTTKNYSRLAGAKGANVHTTVTIGYNTPWRQVHAMLVLASERTRGLRKDPPPFVLQKALSDFYVEYQLNASLERPEERVPVLAALHANIQDAFNEHGVQIMSPHYLSDPPQPVWVPKEKWYTPPAADGGAGAA